MAFPLLSFTAVLCEFRGIATSITVPLSEAIITPFFEFLPNVISMLFICNECIGSSS